MPVFFALGGDSLLFLNPQKQFPLPARSVGFTKCENTTHSSPFGLLEYAPSLPLQPPRMPRPSPPSSELSCLLHLPRPHKARDASSYVMDTRG